MAFLSRTLGTIDINAPIEKDLDKLKVEKWNNQEVLELFKRLNFNRFIDRFDLNNASNDDNEDKILFEINYKKLEENDKIEEVIRSINENKKIFYYLNTCNKPRIYLR